jgi:hypothetical protein
MWGYRLGYLTEEEREMVTFCENLLKDTPDPFEWGETSFNKVQLLNFRKYKMDPFKLRRLYNVILRRHIGVVGSFSS